MAKASNRSLALILSISGALTFLIMGVMNTLLMPAIESTTQGLRCFDMNSFGYTYEQAKEFVSLLTPEGKNTYLHIQLPLDCVFPLVYVSFFCALFKKLGRGKVLFYAVPLLLAVFDYCENACSILMLTSAGFGKELALFASTATVIKSVLMALCIVFAAVFIILYVIGRHKRGQETPSAL